MNEHDPGITGMILGWIINAIFAVALLIGRMTFIRSMQKQDDIEERLRTLERDSVTHEDLRRIEQKMDEQHRHITDRLERMLERSVGGKGRRTASYLLSFQLQSLLYFWL